MTRAALTALLMLLITGCGKYGPPVRTPPTRPAPAAAREAPPAAQTPGPDSEATETDAEEGEE